MKENQSKSWKQRVISALICILVCWVIYVEAMSLIAWHFAREMSQMSPNLGVVPTPLVDTNVAKLDGPRIEKFGFSFQVPWKEIARDKTGKSIAGLAFKEGGSVIIFNPEDEVHGVQALQGKTPNEQKLMNGLLGARSVKLRTIN